MKKLFLLCGILMCFLAGYSQTFNASPTTIASGGTVTVTGNGESTVAYFSSVSIAFLSPTSTPVTANIVSGTLKTYSTATGAKTSFQITFKNPTSSAQNLSVWFACSVNNDVTGNVNTSYQTPISVTVQPTAPVSFPNTAASQTFIKNSCGTGFIGSSVTYTVQAGKYTASTQAAANQLAQNDINANGQNNANTNGQCTAGYYNVAISQSFIKVCTTGGSGTSVVYTVPANSYSAPTQAAANQLAQNDINTNGQNFANANGACVFYNTAISGNFTRNNCGANFSSAPVPYNVPAGKYQSTVSQADADAQAQADLNTNGQANANQIGQCTPVPYITGSGSSNSGETDPYEIVNASAGDTFSWSVHGGGGSIISGQNTQNITIKWNLGGTLPSTGNIVCTLTHTDGTTTTAKFVVNVLTSGHGQ